MGFTHCKAPGEHHHELKHVYITKNTRHGFSVLTPYTLMLHAHQGDRMDKLLKNKLTLMLSQEKG